MEDVMPDIPKPAGDPFTRMDEQIRDRLKRDKHPQATKQGQLGSFVRDEKQRMPSMGSTGSRSGGPGLEEEELMQG